MLWNGRYFSSFELNSGRNYSVIGYNVADELFPNSDPLGKTIVVKKIKL